MSAAAVPNGLPTIQAGSDSRELAAIVAAASTSRDDRSDVGLIALGASLVDLDRRRQRAFREADKASETCSFPDIPEALFWQPTDSRLICLSPERLASYEIDGQGTCCAISLSNNPSWPENEYLPRLLAEWGVNSSARYDALVVSLVVDAIRLGSAA